MEGIFVTLIDLETGIPTGRVSQMEDVEWRQNTDIVHHVES